MKRIFKINITYFLAFIVTLFILLIIPFVSYAQTVSPSNQTPLATAAKYNISFPIAALGNCTDLNSCKTFCDDLINKDTCIAFAKSKGFYKDDSLTTQKDAILAKAKSTLGCDSETSCLNFCSIPTNQDKCNSFAQSNNLQGGVATNPDNQTVINQAKQVLGCSSEATCQSFCEQDANRTKCADFARQVGLRGGEQQIGPGGCTSQQTCQTFCSNPNNYQVCSGFAQSAGENFSGPGGCNSAQSCMTYCQQNPQSCPGFNSSNQTFQSGFNPAEICNRTPNCSWNGSTCFCGNNHPTGSPNPVEMCTRYGCKWTDNSCQCTGIGNSYSCANTTCQSGYAPDPSNNCACIPTVGGNGSSMSYSQQESNCKAGGGTCAAGSTSTFCNCQGYKSPNGSCQPPSGGCGTNSYYDYTRCGCYQNGSNLNPTSGSSSCQPPSQGCGINSYYDYSRCGCYQNGGPYPTSSGTTYCSNSCGSGYGPDPSQNCTCVPIPTSSCQPPSQGCGTNSYYDYSRCGCYQSSGTNPTAGSSCQPPSSGCGTNSYYDYTRCGCYQNGSNPNPTSGSSSCQPPSQGCGTSSYYDYSRCGCYQNSTQPTNPPVSNQPQPTSTSQTAPTSALQPTSAPQPTGIVKGASTTANIWSNIWSFLLGLFK